MNKKIVNKNEIEKTRTKSEKMEKKTEPVKIVKK